MYKLASNGAKVIHPRAVEAAKRFHIPIRVRSTYTDGDGTLISDKPSIIEKSIIGIALDKESQDTTCAYVLPDPQFLSCVKEEIAASISNKAIHALSAICYEDSIKVLMENDHIVDNIKVMHDL
jgi:aspartate kinase